MVTVIRVITHPQRSTLLGRRNNPSPGSGQLETAFTAHGLELVSPGLSCVASDDVAEIVDDLDERPVLVFRDRAESGELVGLLTAFDLL